MRAAWILVLAFGCSKQAADPARESTPPAAPESMPAAPEPAAAESMPAAAADTTANSPRPPPPAKTIHPLTGAVPHADKASARDEARSSGVLGPTEGSAFVVKGTVSIKRASTKPLDGAVRPKLEALQACYDQALEMNDRLAGELTVAIADGAPQVTKSTLHDAELEQCVVAALRAAALPKSRATLVLAFARE